MADETFRSFVQSLIDKAGTASAVADALEMSLSAFVRGVHGGTLSVENCLRLAKWSGTHPSRVLILAGKGDVAALNEELYGAGPPISGQERKLVNLWRDIEPAPDAQDALFTLLRALASAIPQSHRRRA